MSKKIRVIVNSPKPFKAIDTINNLELIEERFKIVTSIKGNLAKFPLIKKDDIQFATNKDKSQTFAEVFTPPHIVDAMLQSVPNLNSSSKNLDLCAGHGQYTVRMLRKFSQDKGFDVLKYLKHNNFLAELQLESCYKLLWVFGTEINLAIGDALQLAKLPLEWRGIWMYVKKVGVWVDITYIIKTEFQKVLEMSSYEEGTEKSFVQLIEKLTAWLNHIAKEPKMELERLVNIPAGRELLKDWVREVATDVEDNWQNVKTPEWVAKEMVRCIPDLKTWSKFLVLFNVELLEALVKEGVSVSKITFGSDSALEEAMVQGIYKRLKTIPLGKTLDEMKAVLKDHAGQYEVVLSNPPYQIQSEAQKGGRQAKTIYHEIVVYVLDVLKPHYACIITPSRWMLGGMGLDTYRRRMINDKRIRIVQDFPGTYDVFSDVAIAGGVSYFLWDRDYNGLCEFNGVTRDIGEFDVLVRDNFSVQIIRKILTKHAGGFCNTLVMPNKPFGLATNFNEWVEEKVQGSIKVYSIHRKINTVLANSIMDVNGILGKHKVCLAAARSQGYLDAEGDGKSSPVFGYTFQIPKGEACTETYIVVGAFNTKKEADNYEVYLQTKFYRFCLKNRLSSLHINREKFAWVPDLGNYSSPVTDTDLYTHFNLTKKEIEHIEATIKEI